MKSACKNCKVTPEKTHVHTLLPVSAPSPETVDILRLPGVEEESLFQKELSEWLSEPARGEERITAIRCGFIFSRSKEEPSE